MADITVTIGDQHLKRVAAAFGGERLGSGDPTLDDVLAAADQDNPAQKIALVEWMSQWWFARTKQRVLTTEASQAAKDYLATAPDLT